MHTLPIRDRAGHGPLPLMHTSEDAEGVGVVRGHVDASKGARPAESCETACFCKTRGRVGGGGGRTSGHWVMHRGTEQSSPPKPAWQKQRPWRQSPTPLQSFRVPTHVR